MSTHVQTAGKVVWHEQHSADPSRAQAFYAELFGWELESFKPGEMDYPMIHVNGQNHGGFWKSEGDHAYWLAHVSVEDADATAERARAGGGSILHGPMDMPEVGRFVILADPQGAVISAYQPEGEGPAASGVFVWDELMTTDVEGAKQFYGDVFGWTSNDMEMGAVGPYTILRAGETDVAGLMGRPEGVEAPPHWLPYVGVDDVDGAAERAQELGAKLVAGPMDIPGDMGRFAVLLDPLHAVFGVFKGQQ